MDLILFLILFLIIIAIAGGLVVNHFLFLILVIALLVWFVGGRGPRRGPPAV